MNIIKDVSKALIAYLCNLAEWGVDLWIYNKGLWSVMISIFDPNTELTFLLMTIRRHKLHDQ